MDVGDGGDGQRRRRLELTAERQLLTRHLVVLAAAVSTHHDHPALDVRRAELVRFRHRAAVVPGAAAVVPGAAAVVQVPAPPRWFPAPRRRFKSRRRRGGSRRRSGGSRPGAAAVVPGAGRQAPAAQHGRERRAEVGVHPAVQERVDAAGAHRDDAQHQVDEPEVRAADAVRVELGDDAEELVRRPGDGEDEHDGRQHPVGARLPAAAARLLPAGADVPEDERVEHGDDQQRQEVLDDQRHDGVQLPDVRRRPAFLARAPADAQRTVSVDHLAGEDGHREGDDRREDGDDEDEDDGDGRRQTALDADDDQREPVDGDHGERERARVDDDAEHGRDDVAQRGAERPLPGHLHVATAHGHHSSTKSKTPRQLETERWPPLKSINGNPT